MGGSGRGADLEGMKIRLSFDQADCDVCVGALGDRVDSPRSYSSTVFALWVLAKLFAVAKPSQGRPP